MTDRPLRPRPAGFGGSNTIGDSPEGLRQTQLAVARAKEGDVEALRFMYMRYANNVYGHVRSIVRDDYEAEEVTQHVFAQLVTHLDTYDERGVPFFAWLARLARNVAIDHQGANRSTPVETVTRPDLRCDTDLDRAPSVKQALCALPSEQREVVVLRHVVGLSPSEIAKRMDRTESPARGLHHRGRRAPGQEVTRYGSDPVTRPLATAPACTSRPGRR